MTEIEIAPPTIADRVRAFLHPPPRVVGGDRDDPPRVVLVRQSCFDDVVLILEALAHVLAVRLKTTDAEEETEVMIEHLKTLVGELTMSGDISENARTHDPDEFKKDLRSLLAEGADPRYQDR
ncbi:MAG: hypothetical protein ACRCYU_13650 [Nocardioides sp.]